MGEKIKLRVAKNKQYVSVGSVMGELAVEAVSPKVSFEKIEGGTRLDITDVDGTKSTVLPDGATGPEGPRGETGAEGVGITDVTLNADYTLTITMSDGTEYMTDSIRGERGEQGVPGPAGPAGPAGERGEQGPAGKDGSDGSDGFQPVANVQQTASGAVVTVTDASGTTTATIENGKDGTPGPAGSPGKDGSAGADGFSPIASVEKSGGTATITITDKNGTTTATVSDGQNGQDGSPGTPGKDGTDGADAVTFTPSVSSEGVISWTNDGGRTNPASVNIRGPQGESGAMVVETVSGTDPVITGVDNHRYVCGTVDTLTLTPPVSGIVDVMFTSGTTPTVLSVPNTVKWPGWFDPTSLEASATYEINIMDGTFGAVGVWT